MRRVAGVGLRDLRNRAGARPAPLRAETHLCGIPWLESGSADGGTRCAATVPGSLESDGQSARAAQAGTADRSGVGPDVRAACGHARYTKGCDLCALVGIYHAHLGRPGITPSERSKVMRLYLAGDKAGLFKLWQARRGEDGS